MKKNRLLILMCATCLLGYAQKETKSVLVVQVAIAPSKELPEKPVSVLSVIETPVQVSTADHDTWTKNDLSLSGSQFKAIQGGPDWIVKLKTSDIKITSRNEKPINEIDNMEYLIKYLYEATVSVTDQSGNVLFQTPLDKSGKEQEIPKGILFLNPAYKVRLAMAKNNPAKINSIVDEMMINVKTEIIGAIVQETGTILDNAYETQEKYVSVGLFSVKGKAYEEVNTINEKLEAVYAKYRALSKKNRVPKEEVDKVMREALPVWEKYATNNKELEENATKGLILNCAWASTWLGEYTKANEYLGKVPEAKFVDSISDNRNASVLSFKQSAENVFYLNKIMQEGKERATFVQ